MRGYYGNSSIGANERPPQPAQAPPPMTVQRGASMYALGIALAGMFGLAIYAVDEGLSRYTSKKTQGRYF